MCPRLPSAGHGVRAHGLDGLLAPAQTPAPVVHKLAEAIARAQASKELQARSAAMELQPFALDPAGFTAHLKTEVPAWRTFFFAHPDIRIDE